MTILTQADVFQPETRPRAALYNVTLVVGASIFIALMAQLTLYLPFSPVPVTGQTLAVLLVGALLGRKRGALAVLAYLTEGLSGMPVFAGGRAGAAALIGPTGGYLAGFVAAAFIVGWLAERGWDRHVFGAMAAMFIGNAAIYLTGLPWLAHFVGTSNALAAGLYPFIPGDVVKLLFAAMLLPTGWHLLRLKK